MNIACLTIVRKKTFWPLLKGIIFGITITLLCFAFQAVHQSNPHHSPPIESLFIIFILISFLVGFSSFCLSDGRKDILQFIAGYLSVTLAILLSIFSLLLAIQMIGAILVAMLFGFFIFSFIDNI